jgi:fermentation-respiration switch protein FrsA (DUF1100 family)
MSGGISAASWIAVAAAAASAAAAVYQGNVQKKTAEVNAELQRRQGEQDKDAAMAQAEKIRKAAQAAQGQANAAIAASGVAIGEGTPLRINEQIAKDSESDAYSVLLTGKRQQQAANDQAGLLQYQGKAAQTGGYLNATASLLSSGSSYNKWQNTQKVA